MKGSDFIKDKRTVFTNAYNRYYPHIFNTVYSRTGNEHDSSDICQEVFLIFFQKFEEVENPAGWLFGTMKNIVYQYYKRKNNLEIDIDSLFEDSSLAYVNGFRNTRIIIKDAVDNANINEEERLLIEYIAFNGYSYTNTAGIMGLSKKQISLRYGKAVRKILDYLKEKGINRIEDLL